MFAIADAESHRHIGNVKLGPIDWVHRRAMFGIMIGEKEFWGKGAGEEVTRLMVEYGFYRLNLRRIGLVVFEEHRSAVRCYEKIGFKILCDPQLNIVAFRSNNTEKLAEILWEKGWYVSYIPQYDCIRVVLMPHTKQKHVVAFLNDLL